MFAKNHSSKGSRNVKESMCECGHLESEHGSRLQKIDLGRSVRIEHDGGCCCGQCSCPKFCWNHFVDETELLHLKEQLIAH